MKKIFCFVLNLSISLFREFYKLLKFIFLDQTKRNEFFQCFFSDSIAFMLVAFGGFAFIVIAMINWAIFIFLVLFLSLYTTLHYFNKQRKLK